MLQINGVSSPRRIQYLRRQKKQSKNQHVHSNLLTFNKHLDTRPKTPSYPSYHQQNRTHKTKQVSSKMIEAFNVCHSKDVFVFKRKVEGEVNIKSKISPRRKLWNSQQKIGTNAEVFLPQPSKKHYRIMPKSSHGKRMSRDQSTKKRIASTSQINRNIKLEPQPWQLQTNLPQIDYLF